MESSAVTVIVAVLASSLLSTIVTQIGEGVRQRRNHSYSEEAQENADLDALKHGLKILLADRMEHVGKQYIARGTISVEQKQKITEMHNCYHNELGGNGDYDVLMGCIEELPVK